MIGIRNPRVGTLLSVEREPNILFSALHSVRSSYVSFQKLALPQSPPDFSENALGAARLLFIEGTVCCKIDFGYVEMYLVMVFLVHLPLNYCHDNGRSCASSI